MTFVAAVIVTVAASCGGGSSSGGDAKSGTRPAKQWVATFCTSISTWSKTVGDASSRFSADIASTGGNVAAARSGLVGIMDDSLRATDTLIAQLNGNGEPAVKNGAKIQTSVVGAFRDGRQIFATARDQAQALPDDPSTFVQKAGQITTSIDKGFEAVGKAFDAADKLDSDHKIANEGDKEPACKAISKA